MRGEETREVKSGGEEKVKDYYTAGCCGRSVLMPVIFEKFVD
jgi:hypothetical protein